MRCLEIDLPGEAALQRRLPSGHTNTPAIAWFQTRKAILGSRCDQVVAIEHGEVEEVPINEHANRVQSHVLRSGAAISVPVKASNGIATAATQFCSEHV